jgi:hypothetical protein
VRAGVDREADDPALLLEIDPVVLVEGRAQGREDPLPALDGRRTVLLPWPMTIASPSRVARMSEDQ